MAPLAGLRLIHDPLQPGVQLWVLHCVLGVGGSRVASGGTMLTRGAIGGKLCRDFIQNFGLGLFPPQESQLPPALSRLCHDGWMVG